MKKIVYLSFIMTLLLTHTGCYDRDIIDSKDGVSLPAVTDLNYTLSGKQATLTWQVPSNIPEGFNRPLSVSVQVFRYRNGILSPIRVHVVTLPGEPTSATYEIPAEEGEYHAVVKLVGQLSQPVYGYSSLVYSPGQTTILK